MEFKKKLSACLAAAMMLSSVPIGTGSALGIGVWAEEEKEYSKQAKNKFSWNDVSDVACALVDGEYPKFYFTGEEIKPQVACFDINDNQIKVLKEGEEGVHIEYPSDCINSNNNEWKEIKIYVNNIHKYTARYEIKKSFIKVDISEAYVETKYFDNDNSAIIKGIKYSLENFHDEYLDFDDNISIFSIYEDPYVGTDKNVRVSLRLADEQAEHDNFAFYDQNRPLGESTFSFQLTGDIDKINISGSLHIVGKPLEETQLKAVFTNGNLIDDTLFTYWEVSDDNETFEEFLDGHTDIYNGTYNLNYSVANKYLRAYVVGNSATTAGRIYSDNVIGPIKAELTDFEIYCKDFWCLSLDMDLNDEEDLDTAQLELVLNPVNGIVNSVSWESSDESKVVVDENGKLTAKETTEKNKPVQITATINDVFKQSTDVYVYDTSIPRINIKADFRNKIIFGTVGEDIYIDYKVIPWSDSKLKSIVFNNDTLVESYSDNPYKFKAIKAGKTEVKVTVIVNGVSYLKNPNKIILTQFDINTLKLYHVYLETSTKTFWLCKAIFFQNF